MLKQISGILAVLLLSLATNFAQAVEIAKLDQSTVVVDSRSHADRGQALQQALYNVLLLNSGAKELKDNPQIQAALPDAASLVVQYSYDKTEEGLQLKATFEHDKVIRLLRQAGLPVWGKQRPLTLVWLATDGTGERALLADGASSDERSQFALASNARGIPLMFPVMDLDDLMAVGVNDVRGMFADTVAKASVRYQADYFAMADMENAPDQSIQFQIALYSKSAAVNPYAPALVSRSGNAETRQEAIAEMMLSLSDYFVSQYAVTDSGTLDMAEIEFSDIQHMSQLVGIESFFSQLTVVKQFHVESIKGNTVRYQLQLIGSRDDLANVLRLEQRMSPVSSTSAPSGYATPISDSQLIGVYRWLGQ
ncbi:hypothetical protein HR45_11135 [Shewanella mangrovi]|uniref:DUF2066 domain-containing protein n=1 Tax=Shewanella mangrovi TaxID=1515746 RepID=A0A094JGR6_9GAMM|nr:DUF2066 domain-containing protein [Shewanella mangrovi]KFZ37229.1 hypothetical protein HR45_11135 [Shewanella mangrovi]